MKVVFIGTNNFSYYSLQKLISIKSKIIGVLTKKSSSFNSDFMDLTPLCKGNNIDYKLVNNNINDEDNLQWIKIKNPDIIFCFGWSQLLKKELLEASKMGVVGYHPSKLPYNRGRHPLVWALSLGLNETASTFFMMDEGADTGDIISQKKVKISKSDTARTLYDKMIDIALIQIEDFVFKLQNNICNFKSQNTEIGNFWRKRGEKDGEIDWRMTSNSIYNLVRSLSEPYVKAHFYYKNQKISVSKVIPSSRGPKNIEPGKVIDIIDNKILIKCGSGSVFLEAYNPKFKVKIGAYI